MNAFKHFAHRKIRDNPQRYGSDRGDINLINDYFIEQGWEPMTIEQLKAIVSLIRRRNEFLKEHEEYDHRVNQKASPYIQMTIFDVLDADTAQQTKKIVRYFTGDESRLGLSNSRVKKSVRDVDDERISAVKVFYPIFKFRPKIKVWRQGRSPYIGNKNNLSGSQTETYIGA